MCFSEERKPPEIFFLDLIYIIELFRFENPNEIKDIYPIRILIRYRNTISKLNPYSSVKFKTCKYRYVPYPGLRLKNKPQPKCGPQS